MLRFLAGLAAGALLARYLAGRQGTPSSAGGQLTVQSIANMAGGTGTACG